MSVELEEFENEGPRPLAARVSDVATDTSYDLGVTPCGTPGSAFAHIETVEIEGKRKTPSKILLHQMTVLFPESEVTAILGPKGAGKTTLLNFLTGSISDGITAQGQVFLSGQTGFVPQEDHLHSFYTCRWYMSHYTRLVGLKDNFANAKLCMDILMSLGMQDDADTIVGDVFRKGLTKGQQRRLSVALEALSSPETLFCDDVTSDLDAESARQLMTFLQHYARASGRRVVLTMHEPSSHIWELIDNVVLLSEGKLVYQGRRNQMESFFSNNNCPCPPNFNPADHYLACVSPEFHLNTKSVDDWVTAYELWEKSGGISGDVENAVADATQFPPSPMSGNFFLGSGGKPLRNSIVTTAEPSHRASALVSLTELIRRYSWNLLLNPGILSMRIFMHCVLSVAVGILFWDLESNTSYSSVQSRIALLFYCVAFFTFLSATAVTFAVMEHGRVNKEVRNGYYHPITFQLAFLLTSVPGTFILALLTTALISSMTGLRAPVSFFTNMFLTLTCAEGVVQLVSHILDHSIQGVAMILGLYGIFILLQGYVLVPSEFPQWLQWAHYIPFHTYSWRSHMVAEFGDSDLIFTSLHNETVLFYNGDAILKEYEIEDVKFVTDMFILFGYGIGINLISTIVLHIRHISNKSHQVKIDRRV